MGNIQGIRHRKGFAHKAFDFFPVSQYQGANPQR
jgi:hypothetical protein